jgi:hypothetical protein
MKVLKVALVFSVVSLLVATGWYRYRWYNYGRKPLFYNTYSTNRDGIGPWGWKPYPGPRFDNFGKAIWVDNDANMAVLIDLGSKSSNVVVWDHQCEQSIQLYINSIGVTVLKTPNSYMTIDASGCKRQRGLQPGEAIRIYHAPNSILREGHTSFTVAQ